MGDPAPVRPSEHRASLGDGPLEGGDPLSLRHALLGLLGDDPQSGYDLFRQLDTTLAPVWPATQSQIYTELARLADLGLVEGGTPGSRRRRVYVRTPAGAHELRRWLLDADLEGVRRNEVLLRARFLAQVQPDEARRLLGRVGQSADARGRLLNRLLAAQEAEAIGPTLALEAARRLAVTESAWAAWAADRLQPAAADRLQPAADRSAADRPPVERPAAGVDRSSADLGHDREMDSEPVPDLHAIRDRIDELDHALVRLLAERSRLVDEVVRYKRARHMRVVDRGREDDMLVRIAETAKREGLDPRIAQQVLRTIVDGFTLLEVEELGPDA